MFDKKKQPQPKFLELDTKSLSSKGWPFLNFLKEKIKGQDRALEYITDAWEVYKAGLRNPEKPIFIGLLIGPSGVGKTLVSEILAESLFGQRSAFTKIRCSEYTHGHEVSKLTGAPPGYIGHTDNPLDLMLSQFNLDKFDFCHQLQTGKLMKTFENSVLKKTADFLTWKKDWEKRIVELTDSNKDDSATKREIADLNKRIRLADKAIEVKMEFLFRLEKYLKDGGNVDELDQEILLDLYADYFKINHFISIVLFDEVEKAHSEFHKHLLEIMDRGTLGVGKGITSFRNSFIFMTANVGSKEIARILGAGNGGLCFEPRELKTVETSDDVDKQIYKIALEAAEDEFKPEFLGRIDKIVVFRPLNRETIKEIIDLEISKIHQNLVQSELPIILHFTETAKNHLLEESAKYLQYGARMVEKKLDRILKTALSRAKNNKMIEAGDVIWVDFVDDEFVFCKELRKSKSNGKNDGKMEIIK